MIIIGSNLKKLDLLKENLAGTAKKISELQERKKRTEKQIEELEAKEFMNIIHKKNYSPTSLADDLALLEKIRATNLSEQDILDLLNDLGGQKDVEIKNDEDEIKEQA